MYAPFGVKPRPKARVIFVGLTPGRQQLALAMEVAREKQTLDPEVLAVELRRKVAFAGQMRTNLVRMLDDLGLPHHLRLESDRPPFSNRHKIACSRRLRCFTQFSAAVGTIGLFRDSTRAALH